MTQSSCHRQVYHETLLIYNTKKEVNYLEGRGSRIEDNPLGKSWRVSMSASPSKAARQRRRRTKSSIAMITVWRCNANCCSALHLEGLVEGEARGRRRVCTQFKRDAPLHELLVWHYQGGGSTVGGSAWPGPVKPKLLFFFPLNPCLASEYIVENSRKE